MPQSLQSRRRLAPEAARPVVVLLLRSPERLGGTAPAPSLAASKRHSEEGRQAQKKVAAEQFGASTFLFAKLRCMV